MGSSRVKILAIIPGGFDAQVDLLAERAEAMVKATPDAIVGGPEPQLRALQSATRTIPLIGMTNDMVADGLVKSLARPGGNTTEPACSPRNSTASARTSSSRRFLGRAG